MVYTQGAFYLSLRSWEKHPFSCKSSNRDRKTFLLFFSRNSLSQNILFYPGLLRMPKIPISEVSVLHFGSRDDQLFSGLLHFWTNFSENLLSNGKIFQKCRFRKMNSFIRRAPSGPTFGNFITPVFIITTNKYHPNHEKRTCWTLWLPSFYGYAHKYIWSHRV